MSRTVKSSTFTLADLARDLSINPKNARRIARNQSKFKKGKSGWVFKASQRRALVAMLKGE
jgi:hypothetical protein